MFDWTEACGQAFETLKEALMLSPVLKYFTYGKQHHLETDSLDSVIAVVLSELDNSQQK